MVKILIEELRGHWRFTLAGAVLGTVVMVFMQAFSFLDTSRAEIMFEVAHPMHVLLSALVTSAMYQHHACRHDKKKCRVPALLAVGYLGSIGIATLSDCLIPYWGELILGMEHAHMHLGIIETPFSVTLAALVGIMIAREAPVTKFPHAGHVLLSTAATLFHIMRSSAEPLTFIKYIAVAVFLFAAVWLPCCVSDIAFPLFFAPKNTD